MLKERIKEACRLRRTNAHQVEVECSLGNGFISKVDKSSPKVENLEKIADYLQVSIDYLTGRTDVPYIQVPIDEVRLQAKSSDLLAVFSLLDREGMNEVIGYANYVLQKQREKKADDSGSEVG